jgi:hypothetical protein
MPHYRLYTLTEAGRRINSAPFEAEYVDDAEAVAGAKQRLRENVIEVWQDTRRVAVVYPDNWSWP